MKAATAGVWTVVEVLPATDGDPEVVQILQAGSEETLVTTARVVDLMVAIAEYLGVASFSTGEDDR